jgi:hypothetical protein
MSDEELERVIGKARRLKELHRARERIRQLERELRGEPAKRQEAPYVPEFLRKQEGGESTMSPAPGRLAVRPTPTGRSGIAGRR